jgi:hypothetical protein
MYDQIRGEAIPLVNGKYEITKKYVYLAFVVKRNNLLDTNFKNPKKAWLTLTFGTNNNILFA